MCGIFGFVGKGPVLATLIRGLRRLEYRGYDSAGVAFLSDNGELAIVRRAGKLDNLERSVPPRDPQGGLGLGHTRWATHGAPSEVNAHPHCDCHGNIGVVHNGIIENHDRLRAELARAGHRFVSQTDTEVLAHLIEGEYEGDLAEAVRRALASVEGAYAVGVMDRRHPDLLVGARKDSPLVVGLSPEAAYLSSDIPALLDFTRSVVFLEEGEIAAVRQDRCRLIDPAGRPVDREPEAIDWKYVVSHKLGYEHFMLKEIEEQPRVLRQNFLSTLDLDSDDFRLRQLDLGEKRLAAIRSVSIVACGTSWHAALIGKFYLERYARIPAGVDLGSEFRYRDLLVSPEHLVVPVSQSGETADTLAAMREARRRGALVLAIGNVVASTMSREADFVLYTHAGPEIGVASTKTFVSQVASLLEFAVAWGRARGTVSEEGARGLRRRLLDLPEQMRHVLAGAERIRALAERYAGYRDFLFLGRGVNYPIALEGALKLKEISYIHAEGYPAGEMKHGPIALIDEAMPVVVVATRGRVYEKILSNIEEVRARGGRTIAIATEGDGRIASLCDDVLYVPAVEEELSPMINALPLQLLAYHVARIRGCDIDQPRNLAKSVTVE